ncbi:MAG: MFS transporter [Shewanella algae]|uniref:MFS transporter n=1 Tax=Shewanella algae TaxID=38313 RepID=UPI000BB668BA|nr:MFS transporter [Shewanella algae]MBO2556358.1 MFS transporter [Shewanella algae]MBO2573292.1 MFS transporter [Shewanella algae]PBQ28358.1 MFS transporter [Shewanella algae]QNH98705.1 MFS transporter [Shewanella algae]QNV05192.1 MFS transporter [Shewanella algae]
MHGLFPAGGQLAWLSACYFFFFGILGVMVPYLGVFFDNRGFDAAEIGFLLAILMATRIVAPNVWALVADRTGMRSELIKLGAFAAALTYLSFFYHGGFLYLALSLALYTFFWNAILAQLEVITLETLGAEANKYGLIRSFGSVGYIVLVVGTGWAIKEFGPEVLLYVGLSLFLGLLGCALPLPSNRASAGAVQNKPALKLGRPLLWFLLSAMLLQASAGPFYGFFVLYLKQVGYTEASAGIFVALGAMAEIFMFMIAPRLLGRYGVKTLLLVSIGMTALRWLLVAFGAESMLLLGLSQLLHAFTFGLTHAASIQFVHRNFDISHRSKGQALYASLSFGVGGALGTWICGLIWGDGSGAFWCWVFAAACALLSMLAVLAIPGSDSRRQSQSDPIDA